MSDNTLTHPSNSPPTIDRAVEVVAMLGDSVVGVRHVTDPQGGVVKAATKALLGAGCALLATSAIAFGYAAHVAAKNEANLKAFTAKGKPAWAFRPEMLSPAFDWITLGGAGLGLGLLTAGLLRRKNEQSETGASRIRLGSAPGVDFAIDGVGSSFELVAPQGNGFVVNALDGTSQPITPATRTRVVLGGATFLVSSVPASKVKLEGESMDRRPFAYFAASAVAGLSLVALLSTVPSTATTASGDDDEMVSAMATGDANSQEDPNPAQPQVGGGADSTNTQSSAHTGLEGVTGMQLANKDPGNHQIQNRGPQSMAYSREQAIEAARTAGILDSEGPLSGAWAKNLTGDSDINSGMSDADIYAMGGGDGTGAPDGFGNGSHGWGPGGGGLDPYHTGAYHTIGSDDPSGHGPHGPGIDTVLGPRDKKFVPIVKPTKDVDTGDGDPSIVRRYIQRAASKISYCYESELIANPGLQGTVSTSFFVLPTGQVQGSTASGVSNKVSSCVANVIAKIQFPAFKFGFNVRYPFWMHEGVG